MPYHGSTGLPNCHKRPSRCHSPQSTIHSPQPTTAEPRRIIGIPHPVIGRISRRRQILHLPALQSAMSGQLYGLGAPGVFTEDLNGLRTSVLGRPAIFEACHARLGRPRRLVSLPVREATLPGCLGEVLVSSQGFTRFGCLCWVSHKDKGCNKFPWRLVPSIECDDRQRRFPWFCQESGGTERMLYTLEETPPSTYTRASIEDHPISSRDLMSARAPTGTSGSLCCSSWNIQVLIF